MKPPLLVLLGVAIGVLLPPFSDSEETIPLTPVAEPKTAQWALLDSEEVVEMVNEFAAHQRDWFESLAPASLEGGFHGKYAEVIAEIMQSGRVHCPIGLLSQFPQQQIEVIQRAGESETLNRTNRSAGICLYPMVECLFTRVAALEFGATGYAVFWKLDHGVWKISHVQLLWISCQ